MENFCDLYDPDNTQNRDGTDINEEIQRNDDCCLNAEQCQHALTGFFGPGRGGQEKTQHFQHKQAADQCQAWSPAIAGLRHQIYGQHADNHQHGCPGKILGLVTAPEAFHFVISRDQEGQLTTADLKIKTRLRRLSRFLRYLIMPPTLYQSGISVDFLRKACFFSLCTVSPLRVGLLTSLCLLSACQTGFGSRAVFQRITLEATLAPSARVELVDVGGHLAPDIVVMTHRPGRLYWFENPTWRNHQVGVTADEFYGLAVLPKIQGEAGADLALSGRFSQPGAGTYEQIIWL